MIIVWNLYDAGASESRGLFSSRDLARQEAEKTHEAMREYSDNWSPITWKATLSDMPGYPGLDADDGYTLIYPEPVYEPGDPCLLGKVWR